MLISVHRGVPPIQRWFQGIALKWMLNYRGHFTIRSRRTLDSIVDFLIFESDDTLCQLCICCCVHRFSSIGLFKFETNPVRSLAVSLVPPAVFIAVMALQLRYFRPDTRVTPQYAAESGISALTLSSLLPK